MPSPSTGAPRARVQTNHPYLALMGLYLGGFTGMYSETALNIALPQLSEAFGVSLSLAQWFVVGYMLVIGIVLPFASLLSKWFSAKGLTLFALGAFFVGSLMSGLAPDFAVALAGRAVQGIGTGLVLPLMFSMVLEVIPPNRIGKAMGVNALVIMSASAVGPTLAGLLIGALSWRAVFFSFAVVLAVGAVFALAFSVSPYKLTRPHVDAASAVLSVLGFGGLVLGFGMSSLTGWASVPTLASLVVGVVCLVLYCRRQLGMDSPIIDMRVFSVKGFRVGALCVMLNFGVTLSTMFVLPQFYQGAMLLSASMAGLLMLPGGIVNAVVSALAGSAYDRVGAKRPALVGFGLSVLATVMLLNASGSSPVAYVVVCHVVLMVGVPLAMSPCQTHALASLPPKLSTDGSTALNTMQQVFAAICTAVTTYLLAAGQASYAAAGGTDGAVAFTQGAHLGFGFALVLAVVALVVATRFGERRESEEAAPSQAAEQPQAAGTSAAQAAPSVSSLMKAPVYTLSSDASALDALKLFASKGISGAPVVGKDGSVAGFVSDGDVISAMSQQSPAFTGFYSFVSDDSAQDFTDRLSALETMPVSRIATRDVVSVQDGDDLRHVCALFTEHHFKKVPVMHGSKMVGIINRSNITNYIARRYAKKA